MTSIFRKELVAYFGFSLFIAILLLPAQAMQVDETLNEINIAFHADDVNTIGKLWRGPEILEGSNFPQNILKECDRVYIMFAGNSSQMSLETMENPITCLVLIMKRQIGASMEDLDELLESSTSKRYTEIRNIKIDGHDGKILQSSDDINGPYEYLMAYWVDEFNSMASQLVFLSSERPWDDETKTLVQTIHVMEVR